MPTAGGNQAIEAAIRPGHRRTEGEGGISRRYVGNWPKCRLIYGWDIQWKEPSRRAGDGRYTNGNKSGPVAKDGEQKGGQERLRKLCKELPDSASKVSLAKVEQLKQLAHEENLLSAAQ